MPITRASSSAINPRRHQSLREPQTNKPQSAHRVSKRQRRKATPQNPPLPDPTRTEITETLDEEDVCPICHLLLYRPVTTKCKHTLCESCMAQWASTSTSTTFRSLEIFHVDDPALPLPVDTAVEAKCPMCRTQTSASLDSGLDEKLRRLYPVSYAERAVEEERDGFVGAKGEEGTVQTLTVVIGNEHRLVPDERHGADEDEGNGNIHEWTFFVRPSRSDIVEEVQILLHPTFRPARIVRQRPPFEIRRRGWGVFSVYAYIILKAGYSWLSPDAENAPDGASKGALPLEWTLDFSGSEGRGSKGRIGLRVRSDRGWEGVDDDVDEDEASWRRTVASYARDGRWEPDEE